MDTVTDAGVKSSWLNLYYSDALEAAAEFSDEFLDDAFIRIERHLLRLRRRAKPTLNKVVVQGQIIGLEHVLAELQHDDSALRIDADLVALYERPGLPEVEWLPVVDELEYPDLYNRQQRAELDYVAPEAARLLQRQPLLSEHQTSVPQQRNAEVTGSPSTPNARDIAQALVDIYTENQRVIESNTVANTVHKHSGKPNFQLAGGATLLTALLSVGSLLLLVFGKL